MKIKYCIFSVVICMFIFMGISIFTSAPFAQEEFPGPPPEELIEEMLADEEIPEEVRRELEEMLREGEIREPGERPAEITPPAEKDYTPIREGREIKEAKITPSAQPNRISLDLKGVDIIDVLKMLSARSNLNIIAGKNVRGRVTLFLKDVDIWDAFEIILAANSLAYEKRGDIINVMTERDYEQLYGEKHYDKKELRVYKLEYVKASDVSKALNQTKSKIGKVIVDEGSNTIVLVDSPGAIANMEEMIAEMDIPIETKVFSLNYAKAEDIKTKISEILTKGVGTMQVDERTNKVVITDLSKKMPEISSVIEEMDEKHKEVLIEAKIVEVSLTDEYAYGVDWKAAFRSLSDQGIRINLDNFTGSVWGGTTGGTITLASVASRNINGVIEALKTVGRTNIISSPRITVLNNEEAKVLVGTKQPYISDTTTVASGDNPITSETITYVDVGVELTVTPTINEEGFVTMRIKPKISSVTDELGTTGARDSIPIVSTSESETTVMVKDGTTIVIAGLIEDRDQIDEEKIPFFGDIPLIGPLLFGNKTKGSTSVPEKKELVIFLTPYIIHGTETFPEAENVWYGDEITQRELLEQQMSFAVEDIQRKRSLMKEPRPRKEAKDTTTRISEDLRLFRKKEGIEELEERRADLRKEVEPVKERGVVPEKVVAGKEAKRATVIPPTNLITPSVSGYYSYFENLRNKIYWVAKDVYPGDLRGKKEDVKVRFKLTNDGGLKGEPEVLNDVDRKLAKAAITAVEKAAPFPPFPKKMEEDEATFRITITYQ